MGYTQNKKWIDGMPIAVRSEQQGFIEAHKSRFITGQCPATLYAKGRVTGNFFTEDSKLYITPFEQERMNGGCVLDRRVKKWDTVSSRIIREYQRYRPSQRDQLYRRFITTYSSMQQNFAEGTENFFSRFSPVKLWNFSIVGAMLLGMVSMTFIYRYLGQDALAENIASPAVAVAEVTELEPAQSREGKVLGEEIVKEASGDLVGKIVQDIEAAKENEFKDKVRKMVKGYPIEAMLPEILEKDQIVAAFLIGIAKKRERLGSTRSSVEWSGLL